MESVEQKFETLDLNPKSKTEIENKKKEVVKKSSYKQEKHEKAKKKLQKTLEYKEGYKSKNSSRPVENNNVNRFNTCENLALLLQDKIANNKIEASPFELKFINVFINEFLNKRQNDKQTCHVGDKCIVWYCRYEHGENRKPECKCVDDKCDKLHVNQALCRNPKHPDNCKMAHRIEEL
jgi:hypothetical protein